MSREQRSEATDGGRVRHTGVFASREDIDETIRVRREAMQAPVMKVGPMWVHEEMRDMFAEHVDVLAQKYGLPPPGKIDGGTTNHYGMTLTGEFTVWEPSP